MKLFLQRILKEIMKTKKYNLEHQTLGWRFICPIVPATQRIKLEIDGFQKDSWRSAIKIKGFPCGYWASIYLLLSSYCNPPPPSLPWWVEQGGCLFGRFKPPQSLTSCLLTLSAAADLSKAAAMPAAPNNEQSKNPDFVQNLFFSLSNRAFSKS